MPARNGVAGDHVLAGSVLADKAHYTNKIVEAVTRTGAQPVIPSKKNRLISRAIDRHLYRDRNEEQFFDYFKQLRRLATRYDKTAVSFLTMARFVSVLLCLQWLFIQTYGK